MWLFWIDLSIITAFKETNFAESLLCVHPDMNLYGFSIFSMCFYDRILLSSLASHGMTSTPFWSNPNSCSAASNACPRSLPASTKKSKVPSKTQSSAIRKDNYSNIIITGYVPETQVDVQDSVDFLLYDVPSKLVDEQLVLGFKSWEILKQTHCCIKEDAMEIHDPLS